MYRICLDNMVLLLDLEAKDFPEVVDRVVHRLESTKAITAKVSAQMKTVLGYRHKHVTKHGLMTRKESANFEMNEKLIHMSGKTQNMEPVKPGILSCLEKGTEGSTVLVGTLDDMDKPVVALVRLSKAVMMPKTTEVSLPVRFIFIAFTPTLDDELDNYEIGRAMGTLLSNPVSDQAHLYQP